MKTAIFMAALALVASSAFASDLSSVGTSSVEATTDYTYTRSINTPYYLAGHQALVGAQVNAGSLGSFVVEAGDTQRVTDYRLNFVTYSVGYANGVKLGSLSLVGGVDYSVLTGDRYILNGNNDAIPTKVVSGVVELNAPVVKNVKAFVDYDHTYAYNSNGNATANGGAVGAYVTAGPVVAKVGYTRSWTAGNGQGLLASLSVKF